jgi:hypothetical protein
VSVERLLDGFDMAGRSLLFSSGRLRAKRGGDTASEIVDTPSEIDITRTSFHLLSDGLEGDILSI